MGDKRRELEPEELIVAERLKNAYTNARAKDRSITQEYVAEQANTNQPLVALYLNGKRPIGTDVLFAMCKAIGVSVADIDPARAEKIVFGGKDEKTRVMGLFSQLDADSQELIVTMMEKMAKQ